MIGCPRRLTALAVAAALLFLTGCTADDQDPDSTQRTDPAPAADPNTPFAEVTIDSSPGTITVQVLPIVRIDEGLVLTLDLRASEAEVGDPADALSQASRSVSLSVTGGWLAFRLVDTAGDQVSPVALDATGDAVVSVPPRQPADDASARVQLLFGDPGTDELALFVPQGDLVTGIPVIEEAIPDVPEEQDPLDPAAAVSAQVFPMTSYSYNLLSTTRTEEDVEVVRIALGSDVLFAVDSADLSQGALEVISAAAAELGTREPGTVQVVGHTDNTAGDAYNQDLSVRRAQSVADELAALIDVGNYPLQVSGRGESEPVADNSSEEGRAANRRVELILATPPMETESEASEIPAPTGPVASGTEGIVVDSSRPWLVTAPSARVVDGHLVVELAITPQDEEIGSVFGPAIFEGRFPSPPGLDRTRNMAGVAVLTGPEAVIPGLHGAGDSAGSVLPLTDLATFNRLDGGQTRTSVLVYPRGIPVGETVTIQLVTQDADGWRLTDIPVEG